MSPEDTLISLIKLLDTYKLSQMGLIITSGDDKKIFIRKYYDLSLLTVISTEQKFCIDIKINHYYLYSY